MRRGDRRTCIKESKTELGLRDGKPPLDEIGCQAGRYRNLNVQDRTCSLKLPRIALASGRMDPEAAKDRHGSGYERGPVVSLGVLPRGPA